MVNGYPDQSILKTYPRPWLTNLAITLTPARRKQTKQEQYEKDIQVVKVTKKKDGSGYHVSGPHLFF